MLSGEEMREIGENVVIDFPFVNKGVPILILEGEDPVSSSFVDGGGAEEGCVGIPMA